MQKPVLASYVIRSALGVSWLYLSVFVVALLLGLSLYVSVFIVSILFGLVTLRMWRVWRREVFDNRGDSLRWSRGTLFSRSSTELSFDAVTVVTLSSTYLQRVLFGTCTVTLDSAGTQGTSLVLRDVPRSLDGYEYISELLCTDKPVFETGPELRGIIMNGVERIIGLMLNLSLLGTGVLVVYSEALEVVLDTLQRSSSLLVLSAFIGSFLILRSVLPTIDLLSRTYVVTSSQVLLQGGFFTRVKQVLNKSAVTDSSATQSFLERLVQVSSVTVSCRGTASNILYRYLGEPKPFLKTLENRRDIDEDSEEEVEDETAVSTFKPSKVRSLIPILFVVSLAVLFPFAILFLVPFIFSLFRPFRTTYSISDTNIMENYSLFSTNERVFSEREITGIRKRVTPFDTLFGTYSVDVWSVGSDSPITLQYINDDTVWNILCSLYPDEDVEKSVQGVCSISAVLQSFIPYFGIYGILLGFLGLSQVTIFSGFALLVWLLYEVYVSDKRILEFGESTVCFSQSGPIRVESVIPRDAVQSGYFTKYLFGYGSVELYIPGYTGFASGTPFFSLLHPASVPYALSEDVREDLICSYGESSVSSKLELWSEALRFIPLGIAAFLVAIFVDIPVFVGLVLGVGLVLLRVIFSSVINIDVRSTGISLTKGILFRRRLFVPFSKIDHVDETRSWYELLCGSYSISVWTMSDGGGNLVSSSLRNRAVIDLVKERLYKNDD